MRHNEKNKFVQSCSDGLLRDDNSLRVFYLFLDLLLLFFLALFPDLFFEDSFPVFSFKETCSRLPLLACPFANCPEISVEDVRDPF